MKCLLPETALTSWKSRPARGAWIEIKLLLVLKGLKMVAPRTGRVD